MKNKILWLTALVLVMSMLTATAMAAVYQSGTVNMGSLRKGDILFPGVVLYNDTSSNPVGIQYHSAAYTGAEDILNDPTWLGESGYGQTNVASNASDAVRAIATGDNWHAWEFVVMRDFSSLMQLRLKAHTHVATEITAGAKKATCKDNGINSHWTCNACGLYFLDEACTKPFNPATESAKLVTEKDPKNHAEASVTHTEASVATCSTPGGIEYWFCSDCNKYFSDAALSTLISEADIARNLDPDNHDWEEEFSFDGGKHWHACKNEKKVAGNEPLTHKKGFENHKMIEVVDVEPTTDSEGYKHDECEVCGYRMNGAAIPAIPVPNLPATGDNSQLALWISLMAISSGILLGSKKFSCKTR